ncbi:NUDIX hydrolase [Pontibacter sp. G13]|uniref:NUDIX hydrolase n=1 Tax=Pontibacter sp. G13 TaxID=3074898 RepID=UPI00288930A2|nr:NUDIX hydrolase [Pontibacter sp. G13]WNJ16263.1 NUDIX hydrolase [Pontibacter sp. G13]
MNKPLNESHKYKLWTSNLKKHGLDIHSIDEKFTRYHGGEPLFSLVMLDATTPEGDKIPPVCFIKGEVVIVLICLIDEATGDRYLLLVKQRRICTGGHIYELVAGMVDGEDDPHDVAVREVAEESGIEVDPAKVVQMNEELLYPSTGTSDEAFYFYYCDLTLPLSEIQALDAQETGLASEHERITTKVVPFDEGKKLITNTNGLLAIYMYQDLIQS